MNVSASAGDGKLFGIDELVEVMVDCTYVPVRNKDGPFFMAVDHCFNISGRGTVLTGTVIQGKVQVKDVSKSKRNRRKGYSAGKRTKSTFASICLIFF